MHPAHHRVGNRGLDAEIFAPLQLHHFRRQPGQKGRRTVIDERLHRSGDELGLDAVRGTDEHVALALEQLAVGIIAAAGIEGKTARFQVDGQELGQDEALAVVGEYRHQHVGRNDPLEVLADLQRRGHGILGQVLGRRQWRTVAPVRDSRILVRGKVGHRKGLVHWAFVAVNGGGVCPSSTVRS